MLMTVSESLRERYRLRTPMPENELRISRSVPFDILD